MIDINKINSINNKKVEILKNNIASGKAKNMNYFYKRTDKDKETLIADIKRVEKLFKEEFGVQMYLVAGTLLGAVREKDFIPYDYDVDLGYVSTKRSHKEVVDEWRYIVCRLSEIDYLKRAFFPGHLHCKTEHKYTLDVWTTFNRRGKYFMIPAINGELNSSVLYPLRTIKFRGVQFNVPSNYEKILSYMYNKWETPLMENWKTFKWKRFLGEK